MKTCSPQRHSGTEKCNPVRRHGIRACPILIVSVSLCLCGSGFAAGTDPGRLFYTPAQRAQLEAARARDLSQPRGQNKTAAPAAPAPLRFDGMLIRSDGKTTRWIDGRPQLDGAAVSGLKPGQVRADGRVYEPYQVLRPTPAAPAAEEPAP